MGRQSSLARQDSLPKRCRPTITQVAAEAGVAVATVSGILNNRSDCRTSPETRERVMRVVNRLGYRPSFMAHALRGKSTRTVGLVYPGIGANDVGMRTVGTFQLVARRRGFMTIIATTENNPTIEDEAITELLDRQVDGLAIHPTEYGPHTQLQRLVEHGLPAVTFDGAGRVEFPLDDVSIDQFEGGRLQGRHLIELGRTRVCVVNASESCYVNDQKIAGLQQSMREAGCPEPTLMNLPLAPVMVGPREPQEFEPIRKFLRRRAREFNALAAVGDVLALASIRIATELGLDVPGDLAVIGFNDISVARHVAPSLSTVCDPAELLAERAFELLHERLVGERVGKDFRRVKLTPELRVRESTAGRGFLAADMAANPSETGSENLPV